MSIVSDYLDAKEAFDDLEIELENYLEEIEERITEVLNEIFSTVYDSKPEDISWGYYVDENYKRCGVEYDGIMIDLSVENIKLYSEFFIDTDRLDDPEWVKELIEEEKQTLGPKALKEIEEAQKKMSKAKEKIQKLAAESGLDIIIND